MWKLLVADTFHLRNYNAQNTYGFFLIIMYMNLFLQFGKNQYFVFFAGIFILSVLVFLLPPIRIAKGLYLCPLTEQDRKKYLKLSWFTRLIFIETILVLLLFLLYFLKTFDLYALILLFLTTSLLFMTTLLLTGFYNPEVVKKQYYLHNKLPVPTNRPLPEKSRIPKNGIILLGIVLVLSIIGLFILVLSAPVTYLWLFYYIPSFLLSFILLLLYFTRYFDLFLTINANYEMYSYAGRRKAGVYHTD